MWVLLQNSRFLASASDAVNIGASVSRNGEGEWGETQT